MFRRTKMNTSPVSTITIPRYRDHERARLKAIALKWARISREKAKENASPQNGLGYNVPAMSGP
jgi:hypothetical protein